MSVSDRALRFLGVLGDLLRALAAEVLLDLLGPWAGLILVDYVLFWILLLGGLCVRRADLLPARF